MTPSPRIHHLDAARATMLLLGIPFHASEIYRLSGGWRIVSPDASFAATLLGASIHVFRMPAFFVLAGFFAAMALERRTEGAWLRERLLRLGVPLVCTALAFGWLEDAIEFALVPGTGFADATLSAWRAGPVAWSNHRWFLVVLLLYCLSAAACRRWWPDGSWLRAFDASRGGTTGVLAFAAALVLVPFAVAGVGVLIGAGGLGLDGSAPYSNFYFRYAAFFACGYALQRLDGGLDRFARFGAAERWLAAVSIALYATTYTGFDAADGRAAVPGTAFVLVRAGADLLAGYYAAKLFFAGTRRFLPARSRVVDYLVDASLCVYLAHFGFVLVLGAAFVRVDWPPTIELGLVSVAALALSIGTFELVRRRRWSALATGAAPVVGPARRSP